MRNLLHILFAFILFLSCKQPANQVLSLSEYFAKQDSGIQTGNEKVIQIESLEKNSIYGPSDSEIIQKLEYFC